MTIDDVPAGRRMDRLIATLVLNRNLENYCVLSLHPDDGQCNGCDLPCTLPRYSTNWAAVREVVDALPFFQLVRLGEKRWQCQSAFCGCLLDHPLGSGDEPPPCGCRYGDADTPELAVGRAALKWVVGGKVE